MTSLQDIVRTSLPAPFPSSQSDTAMVWDREPTARTSAGPAPNPSAAPQPCTSTKSEHIQTSHALHADSTASTVRTSRSTSSSSTPTQIRCMHWLCKGTRMRPNASPRQQPAGSMIARYVPFQTFDSPSLVRGYMNRLADVHKNIAPSAKHRERDASSGVRRPKPLDNWDNIRHLTHRKRRAEEGTLTVAAWADDTGADEFAEAEQASEARGHYEWYAVSPPRSPLKGHCWPDDGKAKVVIGEVANRTDIHRDVVPTMKRLYAQQSDCDDESSERGDDADGNEKIGGVEGKWAEHPSDEEDLDVPNEGYEDTKED